MRNQELATDILLSYTRELAESEVDKENIKIKYESIIVPYLVKGADAEYDPAERDDVLMYMKIPAVKEEILDETVSIDDRIRILTEYMDKSERGE